MVVSSLTSGVNSFSVGNLGRTGSAVTWREGKPLKQCVVPIAVYHRAEAQS
jgi:hypothetical protein